MKTYRIIVTLLLMVMLASGAEAQVSVRRGGSRKSEATTKKSSKKTETPVRVSDPEVKRETPAETTVPKVKKTQAAKRDAAVKTDGVSIRQQNFDEYQRQTADYTPWQHVVYRELDMNPNGGEGAAKNASLYYPVEPMDGLTNMFRVLLSGLCDGKLKGYEYLDGREVFSEKYVVKPTDVLDKFQIAYVQDKDGHLSVEETDVPCNEVMSYYIKERWEFNSQTGSFGPRVLAVCPVLHRVGDFGGEPVKYPMFWIDYEDARPLLRKYQIMSDGMNNAPRYTMEDFFTLGQYDGEIYKVQNTRGLTLAQQYPNPDTLKVVRERIEKRLRGFSDGIWVPNESADVNERTEVHERTSAHESTDAQERTGAHEKGTKKNRRTKETVKEDVPEESEESGSKPRHSAVRRRR